MTINFGRREVLKTGAAGGLALFGGAPLTATFAATGSSAPINVVTSDSTLTLTIFELLKAQKYLEKFGVAIKTLNVPDASRTVAGVVGGSADICVVNGIGLPIAAAAKGAALKILGVNCKLTQVAVYSNKPDVKSAKDLEGKVVGTGAIGALTYQLMVALLQKEGIDYRKVQFRNVGSNTDIFRAVAAGTVDAGPSGIDVMDQLQRYGVHMLSDGDLWAQLPNYVYQGCFAGTKVLSEKRDAITRVMAAFAATFQFMQSPDSQDAFAAARAAATGKNDPAEAASAWNFIQKYKPYAVDPTLTPDQLTFMQKLNVQTGLQSTVAPFEKVVDASVAHDAYALLQKG